MSKKSNDVRKASLPAKAPKSAEPIKRRKLSLDVLDRLLASINSEEHPVNSLLPSERVLMMRYGVGRPAIREALQALERMGLIDIAHGEGARVLPITADAVIGQISNIALHLLKTDDMMLEHLKSARIFFETGMVRNACKEANAAQLKDITAALKDNRAALGDPVQFKASDMAFHHAIAKATGNPIYLAVSRAMLEWLDRSYSHLVQNPGAEETIIAEHEAIHDAICERDAKAAKKAMTAHLLRSNEAHRKK